MPPPTVGSLAPDFDLPCTHVGESDPPRANLARYRGQWLVLVFYPRDFSLVCPTELAALSGRVEEFEQQGCAILGVSTDDLASHKRWIIYAVEDRDGVPVIAMEFLQGQTLNKLLESGPLPQGEAMRLISQVASGMAAAHASGIVHGDAESYAAQLPEPFAGIVREALRADPAARTLSMQQISEMLSEAVV